MNVLFAPEYVRASIVLALICVAMVAGLFAYLSRRTRRECYIFWTVSCVFFATSLAAVIGFGGSTANPSMVMLLTTCLGLSAVFMFAGNLDLANRPLRRSVLWSAVVVVVLYSFVGAFELDNPVWAMVAGLGLLGIARLHAGLLYQHYSARHRGPNLLAVAFILWGLQTLTFPILDLWPMWMATGYLVSAVLMLLVAMGVIVEQEVALTEQKYRGVLDGSSDAIFMVDMWTLEVIDANQHAHRLTKRTAAQLIGMNFVDFCPSLHQEGTSLLDHRKMFNAVFKPHNEFHLARADGSLILSEGETSLVQWQNRPIMQIRVREVADANKIHQMVRRAEKMSALGQLIAGVAHELNNPLAVVVGYAQLLTKQKTGDERVRADLMKILHEGERAAKIVRDLLMFARPCEPQLQTVNLNELITTVLDVREDQIRASGIQLEKHLAANLPLTKADPIQIEQVLTNLIANALYAITTRPTPRMLLVTTEETGFNIRITIADSGPGIPADIVAKIFDPFFTTKPPGKGTGLGLSISHTIIEEHKGKLWVESIPGQGAKFFIELPVVACEAEPAPATGEPPAAATPEHAARLLIVDDEPGIRDVLQAVLSGVGYETDTANDGTMALQRLAEHRYDLIFSDLHMPEMDGETFHAEVERRDPPLAKRIVFVTGDTVSLKTRNFFERTGNRWISKPFNISAVEDLVRNLLREAHSQEAQLAKLYATDPKKPGKRFHPAEKK
jgi:PAS domain S-box-containing protein